MYSLCYGESKRVIEIRWLGSGEGGGVKTHLASQLFYPLYFHFDVHNHGPFWFHLAEIFFVTVFVYNTKNYSFVIQTTIYKLSTYQYNYFILHAWVSVNEGVHAHTTGNNPPPLAMPLAGRKIFVLEIGFPIISSVKTHYLHHYYNWKTIF